MKQVLQRGGVFTVEDVPVPAVPPGFVLVQTRASLLSVGTERMIARTGGASLLQKALARPELVRQALGRVAQDGLRQTVEDVRARREEPVPVGYSAAGVVLDSRVESRDLAPGNRVACAGAGLANHAEIICVPKHLCAAVPQGVSFEEAAFATVGAIALHGVRLAQLQIGSAVAVIGMGLLGQLAAQIAAASGCRVLAIDIDQSRVDLAMTLGALAGARPDTARAAAASFAPGVGVDAVLITADTASNDPLELAGDIARDRAVVVAVGAVGLQVPRQTFYRKELRLLVSRSYGPGRHDPLYEVGGQDYPIGYVRWTEQRNLATVLGLIAEGRLRLAPLVTHRFPQVEAPAAYRLITAGETPFLGVLLTYPEERPALQPLAAAPVSALRRAAADPVGLGVIGAGAFARSVLIPAFKAAEGAALQGVISRQGLSAKAVKDRFGFAYADTDEARLYADERVQAVVIATRHHLHAAQALDAATRGRHVFVEKPLCIREAELPELEAAFTAAGAPLLMVGFNRRFAPLALRLKDWMAAGSPLVAHYSVNAGAIPADHWVHDPAEGGGRIIGEACHFIDLLGWLTESAPVRVWGRPAERPGSSGLGDSMIITLEYPDGSVGTISYVPFGDPAAGKEHLEVHGGGRSARLHDFRLLELYGGRRRTVVRHRLRQDKGHRQACAAFVAALRSGGPSPTPLAGLLASTRATFRAVESARAGQPLPL